jgi:hypothetical protein
MPATNQRASMRPSAASVLPTPSCVAIQATMKTNSDTERPALSVRDIRLGKPM